MQPIGDVDSLRAVEAVVIALHGEESLLRAAGFAVALEAQSLLGTLYGRRVSVIWGPGLNGRDGLLAAKELERRGARVRLVNALEAPAHLSGDDLVIDAAFGVGCSRPYVAPAVDSPVLAVDIPSGVDADSGGLLGEPLRATRTLALGALKWAHVDGEGANYCGEVRVASLGLDFPLRHGLLEENDLEGLAPREGHDYKWRHAVQVVAGSSAMPGAAELACRGALAGGASLVLTTPRPPTPADRLPTEVVRTHRVDPRVRALVIGPGLGPGSRRWLDDLPIPDHLPVVLDADGLRRKIIHRLRHHPLVITPHEGEFTRLTGRPLSPRRIPDVVDLAATLGCVVLLKGPRTVVADPDGRVRVITDSSPALATAGTGDLLAGVIGALLAYGYPPLAAASLGAELHGLSGRTWPLASDFLPVLQRRRG